MSKNLYSLAIFAAVWAAGSSLRAENILLIKNATIVTLAEHQDDPFIGYIAVDESGKIATIGHGAPPVGLYARAIYDAEKRVAMPGFLSGHSHLTGSVTRGRAASEWVTEWRLNSSSKRVEHEPLDLYYYALFGELDMLHGGVTTVYNYASWPKGATFDINYEQAQAEFDAGGHFVFGYGIPLFDKAYDAAGIRADLVKFIEKAHADPAHDLMLKVSIGSIAMRWTEAEAALEFGVLHSIPELHDDMQLHYLEPPPNVPRTVYERSNFVWLKKYHMLGHNLTFAHFVHPTDEILTESAKAGATMIWNPLSNGRLGSGLSDIPRYLRLGLTVGMGIDGQGSADIADPFENMRIGMYGLRFRDSNPHGLQPLDMLRLHTIGTAKAIRVEDKVGSLEVGKYGDVLIVDLHDPDTGPITDLYASLVFACDRSNIKDVFVAGKHIVSHGQHAWIDEQTVKHEVARRMGGDYDGGRSPAAPKSN